MGLYRLIMATLLPLILLRALWRGEGWRDLGERLGFVAGRGPALWLHGASNGELTSARWLVARLSAARPGLRICITANTVTARQMVRDWQMPGITASLAPIDVGFAVGRVLRRWQPAALISLEAEVWPRRMAICAEARVPVMMVGARMSARSHRRWQSRPALIGAALGHVCFASAQDVASRQHLVSLGLPQAALGADLDLKAMAVAARAAPAIAPRAGRAGWLLAASTHEGEEAAVLDAFAASALTHLILAPRHPDRAPAIAALVQARGLAFVQRSQGGGPGQARVLLADTLGEMDLWYGLCGICLIGGTLVDKGGHTPWEPARHDCALLHGASTHNFARTFADLDAAGGAICITAATLPAALAGLDSAAQDRMAAVAAEVLQPTGDPQALLDRILTQSRFQPA